MRGEFLLKLLRIVWASPNTLLGFFIGGMGMLFGARFQLKRGCVEFHGGAVKWLLQRSLLGPGIMAMTIGHVILGQTVAGLELSRDHERVHVRQYERWGPFFLPAYFGWSIYLWVNRKDPYRDNPFEVEAYTLAKLHDQAENPEGES